jgi:hypothetical protein
MALWSSTGDHPTPGLDGRCVLVVTNWYVRRPPHQVPQWLQLNRHSPQVSASSQWSTLQCLSIEMLYLRIKSPGPGRVHQRPHNDGIDYNNGRATHCKTPHATQGWNQLGSKSGRASPIHAAALRPALCHAGLGLTRERVSLLTRLLGRASYWAVAHSAPAFCALGGAAGAHGVWVRTASFSGCGEGWAVARHGTLSFAAPNNADVNGFSTAGDGSGDHCLRCRDTHCACQHMPARTRQLG